MSDTAQLMLVTPPATSAHASLWPPLLHSPFQSASQQRYLMMKAYVIQTESGDPHYNRQGSVLGLRKKQGILPLPQVEIVHEEGGVVGEMVSHCLQYLNEDCFLELMGILF